MSGFFLLVEPVVGGGRLAGSLLGCQPKNHGTPKWMVKIRVPKPMKKWMIWGFPNFLETPTWRIIPGLAWIRGLLRGLLQPFLTRPTLLR